MRTNIDLDETLITRIRMATGLSTKRSVVEAALRYFAAALAEEPGVATHTLGDEMRLAQQARVIAQTPEARVAGALRLGEQQLRLAAQQAGISLAEARRQHELEKDRTRRKAR